LFYNNIYTVLDIINKVDQNFFPTREFPVSFASIDKKNFTTIFLKEKLSRFTVFAIYVSKII